jgi:hypothetical protein
MPIPCFNFCYVFIISIESVPRFLKSGCLCSRSSTGIHDHLFLGLLENAHRLCHGHKFKLALLMLVCGNTKERKWPYFKCYLSPELQIFLPALIVGINYEEYKN